MDSARDAMRTFLRSLMTDMEAERQPPFRESDRSESPIEQDLVLQVSKYLGAEVELRQQVRVETFVGSFRFDMMLQHHGERIAIECDGRRFHSFDRDEWRDAITLGTDQVDRVIRIPGWAIHYQLNDCLALLALWEPAFFTERAALHLERLRSAAFGKTLPDLQAHVHAVRYFYTRSGEECSPEDAENAPGQCRPPIDVFFFRRMRSAGGLTDELRQRFEFALRHAADDLDALIDVASRLAPHLVWRAGLRRPSV